MRPAEFVARLRQPKAAGRGKWKALCPAHEDHNPSLSIATGANGRTLVHCHRGCSEEEIVAALGLEMKDLFADDPLRPAVVAQYEYTDEQGAHLFEVLRYHPKGFKQRVRQGAGWTWSLNGVRRVPYHLPQIVAARDAGKAVFVVEGEKAADALAGLGLVATCSPGGAGKWRARYAGYFEDLHVYILPDNDGPGRDHARDVARSLLPVAASVRLLELPDLPPKGDVVDWIAAGGTLEGLRDFARDVEPLDPDDPRLDDPEPTVTAESAEAWPDSPNLPGLPEPAPLPLDALPPALRAHVASVAGATQTPPDLGAVLALTSVSAAVGGAVEVCVDARGWTEPANVYMVGVLPPATRKTPVYDVMTRPLRDWQRDARDRVLPAWQRARDRVEVAEAELKAAKLAAARGKATSFEVEAARGRLEDAEAEVPVLPRLLASDATPEALVVLMAGQGGRLALMAPEADPLGIADGRYSDGGARVDELLRAWSAEPIDTDRIGRDPVHIERPALTLGLTLQPAALEAVRNVRTLRGRGLFGRILWAVPPDGLGSRLTGRDVPALDVEARDRYGRMIRALTDSAYSADATRTLTLASDALDALYGFEAEIEPALVRELAVLTDWAGKAAGHAVRLAALIELAARAEDGRPLFAEPIGAWAMTAGIRLVRALTTHARAVLCGMDEDERTADLTYVLRRAREIPEGSTLRDLYNVTRARPRLPTMAALRPVVRELVERGCIRLREQEQDGAGRPPSPVVEVHPSLLTPLEAHTHNTQNRPPGRPAEDSAYSAYSAAGVPAGTASAADILLGGER